MCIWDFAVLWPLTKTFLAVKFGKSGRKVSLVVWQPWLVLPNFEVILENWLAFKCNLIYDN